MVGPGDERTRIEGRSYVRASHADRERVIEELKAAFIQGRLEKDELDLRVGKVLASRTYADLNTLTADLPVRPAAPPAACTCTRTGQHARRPGTGCQESSQGLGVRSDRLAGHGGRPGVDRARDCYFAQPDFPADVRLRGDGAGHGPGAAALLDRGPHRRQVLAGARRRVRASGPREIYRKSSPACTSDPAEAAELRCL